MNVRACTPVLGACTISHILIAFRLRKMTFDCRLKNRMVSCVGTIMGLGSSVDSDVVVRCADAFGIRLTGFFCVVVLDGLLLRRSLIVNGLLTSVWFVWGYCCCCYSTL